MRSTATNDRLRQQQQHYIPQANTGVVLFHELHAKKAVVIARTCQVENAHGHTKNGF